MMIARISAASGFSLEAQEVFLGIVDTRPVHAHRDAPLGAQSKTFKALAPEGQLRRIADRSKISMK
jgi:hypothetical protein